MPIKNIVTNQKVTKEKLQRAKELRRQMTLAEKILWEELRANKLGVHFQPPPPSAPPPNPTSLFLVIQEALQCRIWGRLRDGHFPATEALFPLHHSYLLCAIILPVRRSASYGNISYHPHVIEGTGRHP